ncbi:DUF932 domain-containing protein [Candidatus Pacearchaeota archaeon]|nr:DUF932 domain-containing protein [Candidatus Pacearchaeota archaeon]
MIQSRVLNNQQIGWMAPAVFATGAAERTSDRYVQIPTINVIDMFRKDGWFVTDAQQSGSRGTSADADKVKHLIRMQHPDFRYNDEAIDMVVTNAHNGLAGYQINAGVFRFICSNGLMVGESFKKLRVIHAHNQLDEIMEASYGIVKAIPQIAENVKEMKAIELSPAEQGVFAEAAMPILYRKPEDAPITSDRLLGRLRYNDHGRSVWETFNTVQEHAIKGGDRYVTKNGKRNSTRAVKAIPKSEQVNRGLWTLAEGMMKIKNAG